MPKAYLLINSEIGAEKRVIDELSRCMDIIKSFRVYGTYDIISIIESPDMTSLKQNITSKVRTIKGIINTSTLIIV